MKDKRIKVAWVDIDDEILVFLSFFNLYLKEKGFPITSRYIPKSWSYTELLGDRMGDYIVPFVENNTNDLKPIPGAKEFLQTLINRGFIVNLITAHPQHLIMERLANLNRYELPFNNIYLTSHYTPSGNKVFIEKNELIKSLGYGDTSKYKNIMIDDRFLNVKKFVEAGLGVGFTIYRDYNFKDIEECPEDILNKIKISRGWLVEDGTSPAPI